MTLKADVSDQAILNAARKKAQQTGLQYAGDVTPQEAWALFSHREAVLVDVRTVEERETVGYVPHAVHVAWATGAPMTSNPNFLRELESQAGKSDVILFLCRSGRRSVAAAETVSRLGFKNAFNVTEGFEGEQGLHNGWRVHDLPWKKD